MFEVSKAPESLLLAMLCVAACVYNSQPHDEYHAQRLFEMAEVAIQHAQSRPSIELAQAMLLMSIRQTGNGHKASAYSFASRATAVVLTLGLDSSPAAPVVGPTFVRQLIQSLTRCSSGDQESFGTSMCSTSAWQRKQADRSRCHIVIVQLRSQVSTNRTSSSLGLHCLPLQQLVQQVSDTLRPVAVTLLAVFSGPVEWR